MELFVCDSEADGLLDELTKLHVFVFNSLKNDKWHVFVDLDRYYKEKCDKLLETDIDFELHGFDELTDFIHSAGGLICHNILGYDLRALKKLGYIKSFKTQPDHIDGEKVRIYDSLVMSRGLYPDRPLPDGCPQRVYNTVNEKWDIVGPHGLQAWGYRVANAKPKVDDWRNQPLFIYINRAIEDVKINRGTWEALLDEMGDNTNGITWKKPMQEQHRLEFRLGQQGETGVLFNKEKAENLVVEVDKLMKEIEDRVEPGLPPRTLPKSKQPNWPAKPFKKDQSLSTHGFNFAKKFGIEDYDEAFKFVTEIRDGDREIPELTEPMTLANQIDIKQYLVEKEGWQPTIFGTKDVTKDSNKRNLGRDEVRAKVEEYLETNLKNSPYREYQEEILGVESGSPRWKYREAALRNARALPMSPKFKDDRGELCPDLDRLSGDMAKDIVRWLSLRSRRTTLLPLDDKKSTGLLNIPRLEEDGRISAEHAGWTNTYRLKHRNVRNVPKADEKVLLGYEFRDLFCAREGALFQTLDTSNMENMIAAWLAMPFDNGDYYNKVNTGDPHEDNAKAYTKAAGREVGRGEGKGITYGVLYGAQKAKVAKMLGISEKKAQGVIDAFWDTNHGLKGLKKSLEDFWEKTGKKYIKGIDGRRLYTRSKHSLLNTLIQSTGAIMMNLAYCKVYDWMEDEDLLELSPIVIYYHDEVSFEVDKSIITEYGEFETEEEAKAFSVEGKVLSEPTNWKGDGKWCRYYSRSGELMKAAVEEASLELGSPFKLTGEYALGPSWRWTH